MYYNMKDIQILTGILLSQLSPNPRNNLKFFGSSLVSMFLETWYSQTRGLRNEFRQPLMRQPKATIPSQSGTRIPPASHLISSHAVPSHRKLQAVFPEILPSYIFFFFPFASVEMNVSHPLFQTEVTAPAGREWSALLAKQLPPRDR